MTTSTDPLMVTAGERRRLAVLLQRAAHAVAGLKNAVWDPEFPDRPAPGARDIWKGLQDASGPLAAAAAIVKEAHKRRRAADKRG